MRWSPIAVCVSMLMGVPGATPQSGVRPDFERGEVTTPDGARLYYEKGGSGPEAVVVLARLFALEEFRWLAEQYTVVSYDMRNRGRSSLVIDGSRLTLEADVGDLETVRRHFGLERFSLIGYSYLGKVAVMYEMEHPERVERIVQLGPVPPTFSTTYRPEFVATDDPRDPDGVAHLRALREAGAHLTDPRGYCEAEWSVTRVRLVGDPGRVDEVGPSPCDMPNEWPTLLARHMHHHFVGSSQTHRLDPAAIARVRTPVLTIHGTRDRNAPYGAGREWSYLLPNGRLLTVEGAAHQAFAEYRDVVRPAVRTFLEGRWPEAAVKVTDDPRLSER